MGIIIGHLTKRRPVDVRRFNLRTIIRRVVAEDLPQKTHVLQTSAIPCCRLSMTKNSHVPRYAPRGLSAEGGSA